MTKEHIPADPVTAYKRIVDNLVDRTPSLGERLIKEQGTYTKGVGEDCDEFNAFVRSLSPEQRKVLGRICTAERTSAIHDVLAEVTWWIDCTGLTLSYNGVLMPVQLSGMGLHGDYIGRLNGWQWPDSNS